MLKQGIAIMCLATAVAAQAGGILFTTPTPRSSDSNFWVNVRMRAKAEECKTRGDARVVFYGDSIIENWEVEGWGINAWQRHFAKGPYKAIEFGYGGDSTHHLLDRLEKGEGAGLHPVVVVLQIGTNNSWNQPEYPPCDSVLGVQACLDKVRSMFPISKIILCAIPPCGENPDDPRRIKNDVINAEAIKMADHHTVFWCDWGAPLLNSQGRLDRRVMPDFVHPNELGYEMWFEALKPMLDEFLCLKGTPATMKPDTKSEQYWWRERLREKRTQILNKEDRHFNVVLCGDSITHFWESTGKEAWERNFPGLSVLNLGYGGDWTQNLVWRFQNGELDGYEADVMTLMIGTNNTQDSEEDVAGGIRKILDIMRAKQPKARILLLPIFPAWDKDSDTRRKNDATNAIIEEYADGKNIIFLDFNKKLMNPDGSLSQEMFPDQLHPAAPGYEIWCQALKPYLKKFCKPEVKK